MRRFGLYGRYKSSSSFFSRTAFDARAQFGCQFALGVDGFEHRLPPVFQFSKVSEFLLDVPNLHLIEIAGDLFSITRDEGNGGSLIEQLDCCGQALEVDANLLRNMKENSGG